jgi:hypothetical protein
MEPEPTIAASTNPLWRVASIMAVFVAVGSLVVAVIALNHKPRATHTVGKAQINVLNADVQSIKTELTALAGERTRVAKLVSAVAKLGTCLPEITGQINGMSVETAEQGGFVTSAFLHQGKQISSYCQSTLEPSTR